MLSAELPVIVAGGGVRTSGAAGELVALAALQIPVATSAQRQGYHPGQSSALSVGVGRHYSRESANRVVNRADLVCFIGTETGGMTTHFWAVPKIGTPAIQIDIDAEALGRNYPLQAGVNGDAKVTLARMLALGRTRSAGGARPVAEAQDVCREWAAKVQAPALVGHCADAGRAVVPPSSPKHVPDDAIVVVDTGHAGMWMGGMYDLSTATQSYIRSAGHLGWAFRRGLAQSAARRSAQWWRSPATPVSVPHRRRRTAGALEDQRRHRSHHQCEGGNQSKRGFDRVYGGTQTEQARELWTFSKMNFARLAEDMGALGMRGREAGRAPARPLPGAQRPTAR